MHLLKSLNSFPTRRIARLALPRNTVLRNACVAFEGAGRLPEDAGERIQRILASFKEQDATSLNRRDIRFITAAIGSSEQIGAADVSSILSEVERRHDRRLLRAVFRALLASYREHSMRALIRPFVRQHVSALPSDMRDFSERSGILESDGHLQKLGEDLSHSQDVKSYCLSKALNTNILASNYGTELKLAATLQGGEVRRRKATSTAPQLGVFWYRWNTHW